MGKTKEDEEYGFWDLPDWAQGLSVFLAALYLSWVWMPAWKWALVWGSLALATLVGLYVILQDRDDPLSALTAALGDLAKDGGDSGSVEKVGRLSSYQKSKLKDAVGMECEVTGCGTKRSLHVHHITPRSEGGGNELSNLIVVCRNHHADCDNGSFNRTQQRQMIRGDRFVDEGIKEYWRGSVRG